MAEERIQIQIASDGLEARWTIASGESLEREAVAEALEAAGVQFGVDARLKFECENRIGDENFELAEEVIARSTPPRHGKDGSLELNFRPGPQAGTKRADGSLDWLDRSWPVRVAEGDVLAEILPPTEGKPGKRVDGEEIPATPGKPCSVATGDGVEVGEDGSIRALREGAIQYRSGSQLDVLDHYEHTGDVDIRSGHVKSRGSVSITGNVNANFEVNARGDVTIKGAVFGADVVASGSVQVGRGVSGGENGFVDAGGDLSVHHAQSARMRSGGTVVVATDCVGTQLRARKLEVGGSLHGGDTVLETLITTKDAGSASGAGTRLRVAEPFESPFEAKRQEASIEKARRNIARAEAAGCENKRMRKKGGRASRENLAIDRESAKRKLARCSQRAELLKVAHIDVSGTVNVGVQIRFGSRRLDVEETLHATRFCFDEETRSITMARLEP